VGVSTLPAKRATIIAVSRKLPVPLLLAFAMCASAQYGVEQPLSVGDVLVANKKLADPNFAEAVVLLVQYDKDEGTVGLVINRKSEIPLSRIFPDIKHATADPVYIGGPVGIGVGQALLRLPAKTDEARQVSGDIYATGDKDLIEKTVSSRAQPSRFRLYFGYAGWAPGQLEAEIRLGAWTVLKNRSKITFDDDPDSLWDRLIRESETRMADGGNVGACQPGRSFCFLQPLLDYSQIEKASAE
jgi:putative transcriptional regulator